MPSKEYIDGFMVTLQHFDVDIAELERVVAGAKLPPTTTEFYAGRLASMRLAHETVFEAYRHGHDPEPVGTPLRVEQAHDPVKTYARHFIGMIWVGDRPRYEMYFGADDSVHAVAVALDLAKHFGFALSKGARKPVVNGTGANGTINGVTMARITVEERER